MLEWARQSPSVKAIGLSRNFGHQTAVTAGLDASRGDAVVIMDADLQDPPELISEFLRGYAQGYDVVYGHRLEREKESVMKRATATAFYWVMKKFVDARLPSNVGDFRLMSRRVVDDLRKMNERDRFIRGLVAWVGYDQLAVDYVRPGRVAGETKYPMFKMVKFAVTAITTFSDAPLRLVLWCGMFSMGVAMALIVRTLYLHFFGDTPLVQGWASLTVIISFFSGLILLSIGAVGLYIGRIFSESQGRPLYLVKHAINIQGNPFR